MRPDLPSIAKVRTIVKNKERTYLLLVSTARVPVVPPQRSPALTLRIASQVTGPATAILDPTDRHRPDRAALIAASTSKKPQPLWKLLLVVLVGRDLVDGQADRWACKISQPDKQHECCEGHANEQGNDRKGLHGITRIDNIGILSCGETLINGIAGINPS